jgi:hypothetical protein
VEDLNFREFSRLVSQNEMVAFREDVNTLFYNVRDNTRYPIKDERAWKTGIETMYWQNLEINIHVKFRMGTEGKFLSYVPFSGHR